MMGNFGGLTIVNLQDSPTGVVIEFDNMSENLYVKKFSQKRSYCGEIYKYKEENSCEIGNVEEYFYNEERTLRTPDEIVALLIHTVLYEICIYPNDDEFLIDESVVNFYDECSQ